MQSIGSALMVGCGMAAGLFASAVLQAQQRPFVERVEVARLLVDVRVLDEDGRPVSGLEPADFEVKIDGKLARVDSAEWIGASATTAQPSLASNIQRVTARQASSLSSPALASVIDSSPPGRLFVFFVQKPLSADRARDMGGLMRALQVAEPLLAQLTPDDRVAVLSFDSHLRIWSDFTDDISRVRELLRKEVLLGSPGPVASSRDRSLMSVLTRERGQKAYTVEEALLLIGNALEPLPGAKTVVILGFGFGRINPLARTFYDAAVLPGVLEQKYDDARAALLAARATVFSVDITDADRHTLETGLQAVANDTGGFFVRTNLFPDLSMRRVADALAGHYVLFVEKPDVQPGTHRLSVRLVRRDGKVLAPGTIVTSPQ